MPYILHTLTRSITDLRLCVNWTTGSQQDPLSKPRLLQIDKSLILDHPKRPLPISTSRLGRLREALVPAAFGDIRTAVIVSMTVSL